MKSLIPAALAVVLIAPLTAQAAVEVSFTDPAKFTDASQRGTGSVKGRAQTLRTLKTFIERQAARHLAPGQDLKIEIRDVDLAGRTNNFYNPYDIRLMTAIDAPAISLSYALVENGRTLASGDERVIDMNYLMGISWYGSSDLLGYEKTMLKNWLSKRFGKRAD